MEWEAKTATIPVETTCKWADNGGGIGLRVFASR
jgi:hypothetical protein